MSIPAPSIGRIVHYVSHGTPVLDDGTRAFPPACRAAVVTEVDLADPDRVGLAVDNPTGRFYHPLAAGGCRRADGGCTDPAAGGSWHWPERV
ncbi:hypothetical protein [Streptomyces jumonjinensis]|uniref:Uncharacterized protein n=1 Tax=Streptomyces jumonjinensis TaxID=1945 RepID=A0A646KNI5_STRJU|nr:hypothetical protein [Streptomyces jumonjinensis]MQT03852.1 hypothetical protein [Streptomyces jumonjinensis]